MPRYRTVQVGNGSVLEDAARHMRPGDRIISAYPVLTPIPNKAFQVEILLELRHPSWAQQGIGTDTDDVYDNDPGAP